MMPSSGVGEDLQGDLAAQQGVGGLPDLAHPAFPEQGGHVEVPEAGAGTESHDLQVPNGSFYAQALTSSTGRHRPTLVERHCQTSVRRTAVRAKPADSSCCSMCAIECTKARKGLP